MIERDIYPNLEKHLEKEEITMIVGPRQSGKTTLMQLLMQKLTSDGKEYVYLNLDREADFDKLSSQESFENYLQLGLGDTKGYVFVDEIQRKENAGRFIKGIYDNPGTRYKLILSGSGSVELKEKIAESLAGRKRLFTLNTVTFREYLSYVTGYQEQQLDNYLLSSEMDKSIYLQSYLQFGGYPKIVTQMGLDEKFAAIAEIYESYIDKDIKQLAGVQKPKALRDLATIVASQVGGMVNFDDWSSRLNISYETLRNYLFYMQQTFFIGEVLSYHTNTASELSKAPSYYYRDLGMKNYVLNSFTDFNLVASGGESFQNFIYRALLDIPILGKNLRYWRTKDGAEVDFVVVLGAQVVPVEVKYMNIEDVSVTRSLISFIKRYNPKVAYIVHTGKKLTRQIENTQVQFINYSELFVSDAQKLFSV